MGFRSLLAKPFASYIAKKTNEWSSRPAFYQDQVFQSLLKGGAATVFGKDHGLPEVRNHEEFKKQVPIRDYEGLRPYVEQVLAGKPDVLWQGKPIYFAKTSGTTSGTKYIPITRESIPNHIDSARNSLLSYIHETGNS